MLILFPIKLCVSTILLILTTFGDLYRKFQPCHALSNISEGVTIRYTTNGFDSTSSSLIYSASIFLDSTCYSKFNLFSVQNSPDSDWNPPHAVEHIIVIKAALFDSNGNRKGDISTANCIIKDLIGRHIDLPVMSICSDSTSLLS